MIPYISHIIPYIYISHIIPYDPILNSHGMVKHHWIPWIHWGFPGPCRGSRALGLHPVLRGRRGQGRPASTAGRATGSRNVGRTRDAELRYGWNQIMSMYQQLMYVYILVNSKTTTNVFSLWFSWGETRWN
jgi:hypothetical protein